jgi:uroporphyrinogen decarboxylase
VRDLLLKALKGENHSRPPVWLMRQAGRYMPQYRALRQKHSFLEMCHQPELIAEITQMPLKEFDFDAAILFSDILVIPEAWKLGLRFEEGVGPVLEKPIRQASDIEKLPLLPIEALDYVRKGIKLLLPQLQVPLIGFCGAPFTVASYMIEGGSSKDLRKTKQWLMREPKSFHLLLQKIADASIAYLNMQIESGVQALQIFESWAPILAHAQFQEFSLAYLNQILHGLKDKTIPVILFSKGSFAQQLAQIKPAGISVDWQVDISQIRKMIPRIALQGNLDPDVLYGSHETIQREVKRIVDSMKGDPAFIFNLGHGIHPDIPCDAVKRLVETVKNEK